MVRLFCNHNELLCVLVKHAIIIKIIIKWRQPSWKLAKLTLDNKLFQARILRNFKSQVENFVTWNFRDNKRLLKVLQVICLNLLHKESTNGRLYAVPHSLPVNFTHKQTKAKLESSRFLTLNQVFQYFQSIFLTTLYLI